MCTTPCAGRTGAPSVFGPQKGASLADVAALDDPRRRITGPSARNPHRAERVLRRAQRPQGTRT
ncbi:glycerate kinase [Arthrobacter bambusae]|uniref:glycerate kinase n=1 Tax=Arthrobacter bambusae TaxID=1338426 RepID=UPI0035569296